MSSPKRRIFAAGIVVAVIAASLGGISGWHRWKSRCSAQVAETPAEVLQSIHADPADQTDFSQMRTGYAPDQARAVLTSAGKPGGGFHPATYVLYTNDPTFISERPIGYADGDPLLAVQGSVVRINRNTGQAMWGRQPSGRQVNEQQLPGQRIVLQLTDRPMAASFATADGTLQWCTWISNDLTTNWRGSTFSSAVSADGQLYVVREPAKDERGYNAADPSVLFTRIDAATGKIAWEQAVRGVDYVNTLITFGDQILLSQSDPRSTTDDRWVNLNSTKNPEAGALLARSAVTGDATWTYPGPDRSGWTVNVIGVHGDTAVVVARRVKAKPNYRPEDDALNQSWLIGIDQTGKERWRQDLGSGVLTDDLAAKAVLAGDTIITDESKPVHPRPLDPTKHLVARDAATGKVRWTRLAGGSAPNISLKESTVIDDHLIAAATSQMDIDMNGLMSIDLATGKCRAVITAATVRAIVGDGKSVTFLAAGLVVTLNHP
jgi:outer membrane protein assembly factor BamB